MSKKEDKLIKPIETQDAFENILGNEKRLIILDVYHSWYGPCAQMEPTFKSTATNTDFFDMRGIFYNMEIGVVPELSEKYIEKKPKSKPLFLFYLNGKIVAEVLGCDSPQILGALEEHLPVYTPDED
ncbi:unnamed protein product [Amoebophrya sp. A25]|nr:unnamed protein product [Amoebophrya sp. A25]|eukprot:GSA25T00024539001.1